MRIALFIAALAFCAPAFAQYQYLGDKEMKAGARLYRINLGKDWKQMQGAQPAGTSLAMRAKRKRCGSETYFLIKTDFNNDFAYDTTEQFFSRVLPGDITPMVSRMYYPDGELIEKESPIRGNFGNSQAYRSQYRINFSSGRSYELFYYLTFSHGYFVHITAYSLPKDRLRAKPCFEEVFKTIRFAPDTPPTEEGVTP